VRNPSASNPESALLSDLSEFVAEGCGYGKHPIARALFLGLGSVMARNHKSKKGSETRGFSGIIARFMAFIYARMPAGYEDETGFHYGIAPVSPFIEQPPENQIDLLPP